MTRRIAGWQQHATQTERRQAAQVEALTEDVQALMVVVALRRWATAGDPAHRISPSTTRVGIAKSRRPGAVARWRAVRAASVTLASVEAARIPLPRNPDAGEVRRARASR